MSFMDPSVAVNARQLLREDDSLLRQIFFNVLKHHHPQLAAKVGGGWVVRGGLWGVGLVRACTAARTHAARTLACTRSHTLTTHPTCTDPLHHPCKCSLMNYARPPCRLT